MSCRALAPLLVLALLALAHPAAAQGSRIFTYGAGVSDRDASGLHIAATVEDRSGAGAFHRRYDVVLHDLEERDLFLLANLVYRPRPVGLAPYALAGLGVYTGSDLPLAGNVGVGVESSALLSVPLFLEARLLYGTGVYADRRTVGFGEHELIPSVTLGMRIAPRG